MKIHDLLAARNTVVHNFILTYNLSVLGFVLYRVLLQSRFVVHQVTPPRTTTHSFLPNAYSYS